VLKQSIWSEQMKMESPKLQTTADVVAFCLQKQTIEIESRNNHREYRNCRRNVIRFFYLIKNVDRQKKYDCKYFSGVKALHSIVLVSPQDVTLLRIRHLACFCKECDFCLNKSHVRERELETLEPNNISEVCTYVYAASLSLQEYFHLDYC
jgi:hypothetical protein